MLLPLFFRLLFSYEEKINRLKSRKFKVFFVKNIEIALFFSQNSIN